MTIKTIFLAAALVWGADVTVPPAAPPPAAVPETPAAAAATPAMAPATPAVVPAKAKPASLPARKGDAASVVITVGPNRIQKKQIDRMVTQLAKSKQASGRMAPGEKEAMEKMIATNLIGQELLELESKRLNVKAADKEVDSLYKALRANFPDEAKFKQAMKEGGNTEASFREKIARQVKADKLLNAQMPQMERPKFKEILDYYNAHKAFFPINDSLRACQIVFLTGKNAKPEEAAGRQAELEKIRAELARDSADPEMLVTRFVYKARDVSESPEKKDGGDLQRFHPNDFFPEFKKQTTGLRVGRLSKVFRTPLGWHLVLLTERFDGKPDSYRLMISRMLAQEKSGAAAQKLKSYLLSLAARYQVKYLEQAYRDTSPAGVYNL